MVLFGSIIVFFQACFYPDAMLIHQAGFCEKLNVALDHRRSPIKLLKTVAIAIFAFFMSFEFHDRIRRLQDAIFTTAAVRKMRKAGKFPILSRNTTLINPQYLSIGDYFSALHGLRIELFDKYLNQSFTPEVIIGNNVRIGSDCHIGCITRIMIGSNTLIASKVLLMDHSHGASTQEDLSISPANRNLVSKGPIVIGDDVWIGESVVILSGVTIGNGAVIGANSVVTRDIPPKTVAVGTPASTVRKPDG